MCSSDLYLDGGGHCESLVSVFSPLVHSMWGMDKQSGELSSQISSLAANLR